MLSLDQTGNLDDRMRRALERVRGDRELYMRLVELVEAVAEAAPKNRRR